jgi:GAF domain-containing protein
MHCPRCQHENTPTMKFCGECGSSLGPTTPSYSDLKTEVEGLRQALTEAHAHVTEALEREAATSDILRVISSSPADLQPVFAAVLTSAARLCDARDASIFQVDGDRLRLVTHEGPIPSIPLGEFPLRGTSVGRAVLDRRTIHVADMQAEVDEYPEASAFARSYGHRTTLTVPLLRGGEAIGAIGIRRTEVRPFTDRQIELLETFASQAVIAIENVRLFNETKEALEQQTATAEILRVISGSPTDVQPVFDTIVDRALRLCDGLYSGVYQVDGDLLRLVAHNQTGTEAEVMLRGGYPRPLSREGLIGRAILERRVINVSDIESDPDVSEWSRSRSRLLGFRSFLGVPMLREGRPIGAIRVNRSEPRQFSDREIALLETFADQAVIAIENVRLFTELQEKNRALTEAHAQVTEALDQQTATSEILGVISSSPTDVEPVFDAILQSAVRLCDGLFGVAYRFDGERIHVMAHYNQTQESLEVLRQAFSAPADDTSVTGRTILTRSVIDVVDALAEDTPPVTRELASKVGFRSVLSVPMLREQRPLGAIAVARRERRPFSQKEIDLIRTFANQAVIAIENVRLFQELQARNVELTESLEQQTATGEILRVIASSPTDLQPVMDVVAASAARFCGAANAGIWRLEGDVVRLVARHGHSGESAPAGRRGDTIGVSPRSVVGRVVLDRRTIHIEDLQALPEGDFPETLARQRVSLDPFRTVLATPLLREGVPIGVIWMRRNELHPFTEKQIALAKTFAAQAVIAIENVRLFRELEVRNRDLTESLEQQTATGEILRVVSSSPTDTQPVFEAIVRSAARLCDGLFCAAFRFDGERLHRVAHHNFSPATAEALEAEGPIPVDRGSVSGRALLARAPVHIPDIEQVPDASGTLSRARVIGMRAVMAVPMLREGDAVGTIVVGRRDPVPFSDRQIELLETFAAQAVIAIENVRLFNELEVRNRDLTEALEQQTATSEILRVIASSPTDIQRTFDAIAASAARLCEGVQGLVLRFDGRLIHVAAHYGTDSEFESVQRVFPIPLSRGSATGRAILTRDVVHVQAAEDPEYECPELVSPGFTTTLSVPMLRQGSPLGAINVSREAGQPFTDAQIALLRTFADQAVIAIENVRLFKELQEKNRSLTEAHAQVSEALERQTATADILRVISQSQADVEPVFDAIVDNAMRLFRAWSAAVLQSDGELLHLIAARGGLPGSEEHMREQSPWPIDGANPGARCIVERTVIHIQDAESDPTLDPAIQRLARTRGWRSVLAAPMLRDGQPIGVITVHRAEARPFSPAEIELLQTFANQAVIAVENARLLAELQARTADLGRSVEQLTALSDVSRALSSTLDLDAVLRTIVARAGQLAGADACTVSEYDEQAEEFHLRATHNQDEEVVAVAMAMPVRKGEGAAGRMAVTLEPVHIADIAETGAYQGPLRDVLLRSGARALLALPLLREEHLIGGLTVTRKKPGEFSPATIDLLKTFATQSALAIQNARLFREIADKSRLLEAASRHKSEFLANMSHELRTPLNAILGFSEVLAERMFGEVNAKQAEYLQDILSSGRHLLSLINDILDLSKVEAGRLELEPGRFHLPTALDNALTLVRERATRHGIMLGQHLDPKVGDVVADERKVKQILLNLLSNAVKFTSEGGRVDLTATAAEYGVTISVRDTGIGIAPEEQAAIFEEFRQVGRDDARKQEGTGLGLTLAKKFVELHGGRIWVESHVGQGSTFAFTLPVRLEVPRT